jgi:hypothetical protein
MKKLNFVPFLFLIIILSFACSGKKQAKRKPASAADTISVPDTGYTGIKKYYSDDKLIKEITFKNGVREGEMKSFYQGGQLYQRFWYENGLREDSAVWYYLEGQVFRTTPFKHDTIDGIQKQFYRTGQLKAEIKYSKGLRLPFLKEYTVNGHLVTGYPEIVFDITDNYKSKGRVGISLALSNKAEKVTFYRGEFTNGLLDTTKCARIKSAGGKAILELRKSNSPGAGYVGVIAETPTDFGNKYITSKKIELPYKDLK